jgi:hypothetical protein
MVRFDFREALCQRGLPYCVQVEPTTKAWTHNPDQGPPPRTRGPGRPRKRAPIEELPVPLELVEIARSLPAAAVIDCRPVEPLGLPIGPRRHLRPSPAGPISFTSLQTGEKGSWCPAVRDEADRQRAVRRICIAAVKRVTSCRLEYLDWPQKGPKGRLQVRRSTRGGSASCRNR